MKFCSEHPLTTDVDGVTLWRERQSQDRRCLESPGQHARFCPNHVVSSDQPWFAENDIPVPPTPYTRTHHALYIVSSTRASFQASEKIFIPFMQRGHVLTVVLRGWSLLSLNPIRFWTEAPDATHKGPLLTAQCRKTTINPTLASQTQERSPSLEPSDITRTCASASASGMQAVARTEVPKTVGIPTAACSNYVSVFCLMTAFQEGRFW